MFHIIYLHVYSDVLRLLQSYSYAKPIGVSRISLVPIHFCSDGVQLLIRSVRPPNHMAIAPVEQKPDQAMYDIIQNMFGPFIILPFQEVTSNLRQVFGTLLTLNPHSNISP